MKPYGRWLIAQWDRVAGWSCVGIGAVLVTLGAVSVSDAQNVLDQMSYLASSVAVGLFLLGVGAVLILTADSRDEWRKLDEISAALGGRIAPDMNGAAAEVIVTGEGERQPRDSRQPMAFHSMVLPALMLAGAGTVGGAGGVRGAVTEASALRWMQLTVLSVLLALVASTAAHLGARNALGRRFTGLAGALASAVPATTAGASPDLSGLDASVYVVAGSSLYHQPGCDLLRYSHAEATTARDGREPCRVCR